MTRLHHLALGLVALALTAVSAPAFAAVNGECLWKSLPDASRAEMIQGYRDKGLASLGEINISDDLTLTLRAKCNLKPEEDYTAGEVLGAMILENGADQVLFERSGIKKGSLDKAYRGLSASDRESLKVFGLQLLKNDTSGVEEAARIVFAVTGNLGLPTTELNNDVFGYLIGRAIREARQEGR